MAQGRGKRLHRQSQKNQGCGEFHPFRKHFRGFPDDRLRRYPQGPVEGIDSKTKEYGTAGKDDEIHRRSPFSKDTIQYKERGNIGGRPHQKKNQGGSGADSFHDQAAATGVDAVAQI